MNYPKRFQELIDCFKLLPGVGTKTAERYAFSLLNLDEEKTKEFSNIIENIKKNITTCPNCGLSTSIPTHLNDKYPTLIGWCDTNAGFMCVFECPICFEKFRYHISTTGRWDKEKFYEDFALHFYLQSTRK